MVPPLRRVTLVKRQSNQSALPLTYGPSLGLGVPSLSLPMGRVDQEQEHGDLPVGLSGKGGRGGRPAGLLFY